MGRVIRSQRKSAGSIFKSNATVKFREQNSLQLREILKPSQSNSEEGNADLKESEKAPATEIVDVNQPQICNNKGCNQTLEEFDNREKGRIYTVFTGSTCYQ